MARLSVSIPPGKKHPAHGNKRPRQSMQTEQELQRKPSMSAYYRPQQRGFINLHSWDEDETDAEAILRA